MKTIEIVDQDADEINDCETCNGTGFVACHNHGAELDEDGWCVTCEAPMDGGPSHPVSCDCQRD